MKPDGSFRLNLDYFDYCTGLRMTNARFHELFGGPPRKAEEPLTQHHMDVAASIQAVTDEAVLRLTRAIAAETGLPNLCLAGGVALNCVVNGRVLRDGRFERLSIQPAAGDAGGALGAALCGYHLFEGEPRTRLGTLDAMEGSYLGPSFAQEDIERRLKQLGAACPPGSGADRDNGGRESFRPFAPSVLVEEAGKWFDLDAESPYMLIVADVAPRHRRAP